MKPCQQSWARTCATCFFWKSNDDCCMEPWCVRKKKTKQSSEICALWTPNKNAPLPTEKTLEEKVEDLRWRMTIFESRVRNLQRTKREEKAERVRRIKFSGVSLKIPKKTIEEELAHGTQVGAVRGTGAGEGEKVK